MSMQVTGTITIKKDDGPKEIINGEDKAIFKDPKTDNGLKKSLKGRISIGKEDGELVAYDDTMPEERTEARMLGQDMLQTVWKDGKFIKTIGFDEVRKNAGF